MTGCSLFRGQSSADGKRPWWGTGQAQQKQSSTPENFSLDDPLFKGGGGNEEMTALAGRVIDRTNTPLGNAYIRLSSLDEMGSKEAPIDVAVHPDGFFTIYGVKRGKEYKLEARAMQGNKMIAQTAFATAPHSPLVLVLKEENVTPETPPLPPPPGMPLVPKSVPPPKKDKKLEKEKTGSAGGMGWGTTPEKKADNSGLSIGPPQMVNPFATGDNPPGDWSGPTQPPPPPKFPQNFAAGPFDPTKPPVVKTPPGDGSKLPVPAWEAEPGAGSQANPSMPPGKGSAHVPSCLVVGNKLINFALPDFYGNAWEWKANRLGKVVLLDFWRTNCPPCIASIDNLRALQNKYGPSGLEILGIAAENHGTLEEQRARVAVKCQLKQTNYRILMATGNNDPVLNHFAVYQLPTLILLDQQGNILWRHEGGLNADGWRALDMHIQMKLGQ